MASMDSAVWYGHMHRAHTGIQERREFALAEPTVWVTRRYGLYDVVEPTSGDSGQSRGSIGRTMDGINPIEVPMSTFSQR